MACVAGVELQTKAASAPSSKTLRARVPTRPIVLTAPVNHRANFVVKAIFTQEQYLRGVAPCIAPFDEFRHEFVPNYETRDVDSENL